MTLFLLYFSAQRCTPTTSAVHDVVPGVQQLAGRDIYNSGDNHTTINLNITGNVQNLVAGGTAADPSAAGPSAAGPSVTIEPAAMVDEQDQDSVD